jgi:tartrate-resistant acid phosphatase type 5
MRGLLAVALGAAALGAGTAAAPAAAAPVHFAVKGDWGTGSAGQAAVTRRMCGEARRRPFAFVLTTGDNFNRPDGVATRATYWRPERCLLEMRIPWRAAWGNHDVRGPSTASVLGAPGRYYAFSAGPARFIVLDANAPTDRAQLAFLRRELSRSPERVRIVALHQPVYTSGIHGASPDQQRLWAPLFRAGRVALVLQGHNHMYERIERDGVTYITTSGGGDRLYPCVRPTPGLRACAFAFHFLLVTAAERSIDVRAVTPRGRVIERVTIPVPSRPR